MSIVNLVVVAHPDDEVIGFGGTGAKQVALGEKVQPVILCGHVNIRAQRPSDNDLYNDIANANKELGFEYPILGDFPNVRMNTVGHVDIVQFIELQIEQFKPKRIFTHHPNDLNDDHLQVAKACLVAARLFQRRPDILPIEEIYFLETVSSTDWAFPHINSTFQPTIFTEVGDYMDKKIKALSHYRNVMRPFPHPRSKEVVYGLAAYRGGQAGLNYAEAFQLAFKRGI